MEGGFYLHGMNAEFAVSRPLRELDLGHKLRPHPVGPLVGFRPLAERAVARLERALIAFMLDLKTREQGYLEIAPPLMVNTATATSTGHLPKNADTMYHDAEEDYWFIPTAELPLTSMYRDEILEAVRLPIYLAAYTPCFRREKMSAGRDVRGIKRGHQFDKVEMVKLVRPETWEITVFEDKTSAKDVT